jgi:hypothetical protein
VGELQLLEITQASATSRQFLIEGRVAPSAIVNRLLPSHRKKIGLFYYKKFSPVSAFAESAKPNATAARPAAISAPLKATGQGSMKLRRIATMNGEPIKKQ